MMVLVFVAGMIVGGIVGIVMMSLCAVSKSDDDSRGDGDVQEM